MNLEYLAENLQAVIAAANNGDAAAAESRCRSILADHPDHPDALQLMGLILKKKGERESAENYLRQSLKVKHDQPHVWNNLGNLYSEAGDVTAAETAYRVTLNMVPDHTDALAGLALLLLETDRPEEAQEKAGTLVSLDREDARGHCLRGRALEAVQDFENACEALVQAVKLKPDYFAAQHHLGRVLRYVGLPEQAAERYMAALKLNPVSAELYYDFGHALYDLGHIEEALHAYRQAVHLKPDFLAAHEILNNLYWEHKRHDLFLQSYRDAIERAPGAEGLYIACANKLLHIGRREEASAILLKARERIGVSAGIAHALARLEAWQENWDEAFSWFERSIDKDPERVAAYQDYGRVLIIREKCDKAYDLIAKARQMAPSDQETIAYEWLCLRLLNKPQAKSLYDYDRFVRIFDLRCPVGFTDMAAFNRALAEYLHSLHKTETHPFDQTLRFGTQTHGLLFESPNILIQQLLALIKEAVDQYIRELPDDPGHPFLGRRSGDFAIAGSWSVRLGANGYHFNHTHSSGWISSAYYVELPDDLDESEKEGWIKFGESNLELGEREEIGKMVRPEVGRLVLFPSYMYHGTVPIRSTKPRMTVAFDVIPRERPSGADL